MVAQQRRFRSREEREAIRDEAHESLASSGLSRSAPVHGIADVYAVLDAFVQAAGTGRQFDGVVEMPELGARIEYVLPGRRVLRHAVRLVSCRTEGVE